MMSIGADMIGRLECMDTSCIEMWKCGKALKQKITGMVDPVYIQAIVDRMVRFANVSAFALILHLKTTYAKITIIELEANKESMKQQSDVMIPFKNFITHIENGADFAEQADTPFTQAHLVNIGYNIMNKMGTFQNECKDWSHFPIVDHNWVNFKFDLTTDYNK
jgi:hypothetical protein